MGACDMISRGFGAEDKREGKMKSPTQTRSTSGAWEAGEGLPSTSAHAASGSAGRPVAVVAGLPRCDHLSEGRHRKRGARSAWLKRGVPETGGGPK